MAFKKKRSNFQGHLSLQAYAGDIGLTISAEEAVSDIRRGTPLNYRVKFPPGSQTPRIVSVNYNNEELCDEKAGKEKSKIC